MDEKVPAGRHASHEYLSLAERVVHHAGKLQPHADDVQRTVEALQADAFCWEETIGLAQRHWVLPLLAGNLRGLRELRRWVPAKVDRVLRLAQFGAEGRTQAVLGAFNPVGQEWSAQGVRFAFMKGAALCRTVYPLGWRLLNDIDVLVRGPDVAQAQATLMRHGFEPEAATGGARRPAHAHQASFCRAWTAQGPLVIDLHWRMHDFPGLEVDTDELLGRAREPARSNGVKGLVLCAEDCLVHYATQLVADILRTNALRLADIHALASVPLDWRLLVDIAARSGAAGPTFAALRLAADRRAAVPAGVLADLAGACGGSMDAAEILCDPRWPFGRWRLSHAAKHYLVHGLRVGRRANADGDRLKRAAFWARLGAALRKHRLGAIGTLIGATPWAVRLWAARCASWLGAAQLATRLRRTLWRPRKDHRPGRPRSLAITDSAPALSRDVRQ